MDTKFLIYEGILCIKIPTTVALLGMFRKIPPPPFSSTPVAAVYGQLFYATGSGRSVDFSIIRHGCAIIIGRHIIIVRLFIKHD
jgi:hypothetical protein